MRRHGLPLALLLGYGLSFAAAALGRGVLAFDDHPGQLYRLWHVVAHGPAPWSWNSGWWAGYPELQFYPPGFAYVGALIHFVTLRAFPLETIYQALLWLIYLLPGLAVYALLSRALGSPWLALAGAFVTLTISAETRSGVEEGLRWGLVASRLGWGLLPLLGLSLLSWVREGTASTRRVAVLVAAVILAHPVHAPTALLLVALAAGVGAGPERARPALLMVAGGFGLSAIWLLPLIARPSMTLPLAWGDATLPGLAHRLVDYPLLGLLAIANVAAWLIHHRRPLDTACFWLLTLAPAGLALLVLDAVVAAPLSFHWLPADRLADGLVLSLLLGAGVALAAAARAMPGTPPWALATLAVAGALALSAGGGEPALSLWPRPAQWPTHDEVVRGTRLDDLWALLRQAPAGRVLFVRSSVPLEFRPEWWRPHSHLTALTPIRSGRDIVNGTFTHPSPVAGFVYKGSPAATPITLLVEQRDGLTLFGQRLEAIRPGQFERIAAALRVSVVVALEEDADKLGFVTEHPDFAASRKIGPFVVFVSRVARPLPETVAPGHLRTTVSSDTGWWSPGIAFSPLWTAESPTGRLRTRRGAIGLLELEGPARGGDVVELRYRAGTIEWAGAALSAATALLLISGFRRGIRPVDRSVERPRSTSTS